MKDALFQKLLDRINIQNKTYNIERIEEAYTVARNAHEGQLRSSGDPYITHPIEVAIILVELGMDTDTIIGGLLHDVVEDTPVTKEDIEKEFGSDVANLVDGVTKLANIPYSTRAEQQAENVRKMLLAMAKDVRVVIIKLADRLHNMRTLEFRSQEKQRAKSLETMEIYAPLAHRLGIRNLKEELEDISLKHLDPVAYHEIESQLEQRNENRQGFINSIVQQIKQRLEMENIDAQVDGRVKSIYGIYRKMYIQGRSFDEIYDIYAVRIIVDSVLECYNILGIIHDMLRPIPNRFKDYISTPKQNMYQSLHTTVLNHEGIPFEVQIRTWDMHYTAEYGVAAHWKYKIGLESKDSLDDRLAWIRQLLESQKESEDVEDLVSSIKSDLAPEEVFVFTPKGDVIRLPVGSTVIDFAYAIHSAVGNKMVGAKVDGRIVSLDFKVKTGMIVEVLTTSSVSNGPSRDWLNIVKTSEARNKIRSWFKKEKREENILEGKATLEREFKRNYINPPESEKEAFIESIATRQHFNNVDDFYASIGYGGLSLEKIIPRIKEEFNAVYRRKDDAPLIPIVSNRESNKASNGVIVEGLNGCLIKFARCCNPLPGDSIIGFITRGYGVSIHKQDCANVVNAQNSPENEERWVCVSWASTIKETFKSSLVIITNDRMGMLADISVKLSGLHVPIHSMIARELKDNHSMIQITIGITDIDQLRTIMDHISRISGVESVSRAVQS